MSMRGKPEYMSQPIAHQYNPFSSLGDAICMGIYLLKGYVIAERQQCLYRLANVLAIPCRQESLNIFHEEPFGSRCVKDSDVLS